MGWDEQLTIGEFAVGADQVMVLYVGPDYGGPVDVASLVQQVAADGDRRATAGWRIAATMTVPMRQTGTTGNMLFQTGGQFATQVALVVTYERRVTSG